MEISIDRELQCQALLVLRFTQGKVRVDRFDDAFPDLTYVLKSRDPMPQGMKAGERIYGSMKRIEGSSSRADFLPMFQSTGS